MRWLLVGAAVAAVAGEVALLGEASAAAVAADTAAGLAFLAVGIDAARRGSVARAACAYGGGVLWFAANLVDGVATLHRPLFVLAVLVSPTSRPSGRPVGPVVALALAAALLVAGDRGAELGVATGLAVAVAAVAPYAAGSVVRRRVGAGRAGAGAVLGLAIAGPAALRAWRPFSASAATVGIAYGALVALAGALLLVDLAVRRRRAELADSVVELTELDDVLVGDLVTALRAADLDPEAMAVLDSVSDLLDENAGLHDRLAAQVEEVRRSRRRLVEAADLERRRLARGLATSAQRHLDELGATIAAVEAVPGDADGELVARLAGELASTRDDLDQLARGLHPRLLVEEGLQASLADLARRATIPTTVAAPDLRFPTTVETTVWYVCAEAAANVAKHAGARSLDIVVALHGEVLVATIVDDGVGGARPGPGSGLAGLADRLDAVGGRLEVEDRAEGGTRLRAWVPVA